MMFLAEKLCFGLSCFPLAIDHIMTSMVALSSEWKFIFLFQVIANVRIPPIIVHVPMSLEILDSVRAEKISYFFVFRRLTVCASGKKNGRTSLRKQITGRKVSEKKIRGNKTTSAGQD